MSCVVGVFLSKQHSGQTVVVKEIDERDDYLRRVGQKHIGEEGSAVASRTDQVVGRDVANPRAPHARECVGLIIQALVSFDTADEKAQASEPSEY